MNSNCPCCHRFLLKSERCIMNQKGIDVAYCRECYKLLFEGYLDDLLG